MISNNRDLDIIVDIQVIFSVKCGENKSGSKHGYGIKVISGRQYLEHLHHSSGRIQKHLFEGVYTLLYLLQHYLQELSDGKKLRAFSIKYGL